jgi:hypothetical protein
MSESDFPRQKPDLPVSASFARSAVRAHVGHSRTASSLPKPDIRTVGSAPSPDTRSGQSSRRLALGPPKSLRYAEAASPLAGRPATR